MPKLYRYEDWDAILDKEHIPHPEEDDVILVPLPLKQNMDRTDNNVNVIKDYNPAKDFHVIDIPE